MNIIKNLSINTVVLVLLMLSHGSDISAQCYEPCNNRNTFSHYNGQRSDCGNTVGLDGCSFATGKGADASGDYSIAAGSGSADGVAAFSFGRDAESNGEYSMALGDSSIVTTNGSSSFALGGNSIVDAPNAFAIGSNMTNNGSRSFLFGGVNAVNNTSESFTLTWTDASTATTPLIYSDLSDFGGNGFVGLNANTTVSSSTDIDLTVRAHAEKFDGSAFWITPSDKRLKEDIEPFNDGLDVLSNIDPVWFRYNGKLNLPTRERQVGIIAQEVQKVAPYMIHGNEEDGEYLTYNGNAMLYLLINSVQEQQQMIDEEMKEVRELEQSVALKNQRISELQDEVRELNTPAIRREHSGINGNVTLSYYVPLNVSEAQLVFYDNTTQKLLNTVNLKGKAFGEVSVDTENLKTGEYSYSLIVNGEEIKTDSFHVSK